MRVSSDAPGRSMRGGRVVGPRFHTPVKTGFFLELQTADALVTYGNLLGETTEV